MMIIFNSISNSTAQEGLEKDLNPGNTTLKTITRLDYKTIDLFFIKIDNSLIIEAIGPDSEWAYSPIKIPKKIDVNVFNEEQEIKLGDLLGTFLLPGNVLNLYKAVLGRILVQPRMGLRLKLHFIEEAKAYAWLPWEATRIEGKKLVMDGRQSIVRTLDLLEPALPLEFENPPYLIASISSLPKDAPQFEIEKEQKQFDKALEKLVEAGLVRIYALKDPSPEEFESFIREREYHILYFTGYASHDEKHTIHLVFCNDEKSPIFVNSIKFADMIRGTGIRIAFINTGSSISSFVEKSSKGVLEALLEVGIPIGVGLNGIVTIESSLAFAKEFFSNIAKSNSLDDSMIAGRRAMPPQLFDWFSPVLFIRTSETKFWYGEAGFKVESFLDADGKLVSMASKAGEFYPELFAKRLQATKEALPKIMDMADQTKAKNLIAEIEDAIANQDQTAASQKITETSTFIFNVLSTQERTMIQTKQENKARWTVLCVSSLLLLVVAALSYYLRESWTPELSIPVIGIPISVIVWSFIGGVAAILQDFVSSKKEQCQKIINYEYLLWRPLVGILMGTTVYLAIASGLVVLLQGNTNILSSLGNNYLLWVLAFLGGFSDRFAEFVFDNIVRRFSEQATTD
jgi:uncharacterized membrane-anchored protein